MAIEIRERGEMDIERSEIEIRERRDRLAIETCDQFRDGHRYWRKRIERDIRERQRGMRDRCRN